MVVQVMMYNPVINAVAIDRKYPLLCCEHTYYFFMFRATILISNNHMRIPRLITRKPCYLPTGAGWVFVSFSLLLLLTLFSITIHPFLAPCTPLEGEALIIEGWVPDYCLESVAHLFDRNHYRAIFVTGGPLESGSYLKEYKNYAALGAATLRILLIPDSVIVAVPAAHTPVDRTYTSAAAFKKWVDSTRCPFRVFDLCSQATHTRRSTILFKRALGKSFKIGSIAITDPDYDPRFWWRSSKGVRSVIDECIALLYALLFITFK